MSTLLIQEEFVAYLPSLARVVGGIPEAVTLQAIWFKADKQTGELVMSRAELADYLGTSPSSLGRYVKHLASLGVLTYEGRSRVGYDKTTKFTVDPNALDALVQDAATGVTAPPQDAATASAESSQSEAGSVQDAPTRLTTPQSVKVTHSQSVNLTHSSTKNEKNSSTTAPTGPTLKERMDEVKRTGGNVIEFLPEIAETLGWAPPLQDLVRAEKQWSWAHGGWRAVEVARDYVIHCRKKQWTPNVDGWWRAMDYENTDRDRRNRGRAYAPNGVPL